MDSEVLKKVLKYISIKPRSEREVKNYLVKKCNLSEAKIEEVLDYLRKNNLVDDSFLKESYIHSRVSRGFGKRYIKLKLAMRGIEVKDEEIKVDIDRVVEIVRKKYSKDLEKDREKAKRKIFNFLCYRGFSREEIFNIIKKVFD